MGRKEIKAETNQMTAIVQGTDFLVNHSVYWSGSLMWMYLKNTLVRHGSALSCVRLLIYVYPHANAAFTNEKKWLFVLFFGLIMLPSTITLSARNFKTDERKI